MPQPSPRAGDNDQSDRKRCSQVPTRSEAAECSALEQRGQHLPLRTQHSSLHAHSHAGKPWRAAPLPVARCPLPAARALTHKMAPSPRLAPPSAPRPALWCHGCRCRGGLTQVAEEAERAKSRRRAGFTPSCPVPSTHRGAGSALGAPCHREPPRSPSQALCSAASQPQRQRKRAQLGSI